MKSRILGVFALAAEGFARITASTASSRSSKAEVSKLTVHNGACITRLVDTTRSCPALVSRTARRRLLWLFGLGVDKPEVPVSSHLPTCRILGSPINASKSTQPPFIERRNRHADISLGVERFLTFSPSKSNTRFDLQPIGSTTVRAPIDLPCEGQLQSLPIRLSHQLCATTCSLAQPPAIE